MGKTLNISSLPLIDLQGDLSQVQVLCLFGVGDGSFYRTLSRWLKKQPDRFLIVLEPDPEKEWKGEDPKVRFYSISLQDEEVFRRSLGNLFFSPFPMQHLPGWRISAREVFLKLDKYRLGVDLLASDCQDMGLKVLGNLFSHLKTVEESKLGYTLEGSCRGVPAVVCGAGPL